MEHLKIERERLTSNNVDEKTMRIEVKQLRCDMIKLKLKNKLIAEKIDILEEQNEECEIETLKHFNWKYRNFKQRIETRNIE